MLILASQSPTRKALLRHAGIAFEAVAPRVNERAVEAAMAVEERTPVAVAERLAAEKALAVQGEAAIGADQILDLDGTILHKAETPEAARTRLDQLRGRSHRLHTAVALAISGTIVWRHAAPASLTMRDWPAAERDAVLDAEGADILGSTGAYLRPSPGCSHASKATISPSLVCRCRLLTALWCAPDPERFT